MAQAGFLGQGMKFPPQINPATGRFETVSAEESVKESVYLILMTQKTERPMLPEFGTNLMSYTFMDMNYTQLNMIIRTIKDQLMVQEPRIRDVDITADLESRPGAVLFQIDYTVRDTNTRDNLVFPFYLNAEGPEEEEEEEEYEPEDVAEEISD